MLAGGSAAAQTPDPEQGSGAAGSVPPLSEGFSGKAVVIPLDDEDLRSGRGLRELERLVEAAGGAGAAVLLFELSLSEPYPPATTERLLGIFAEASLPAIAWVHSSATGAGALVALACKAIYVDEAAVIGAGGLAGTGNGGEGDGEKSGDGEKAVASREAAQRLAVAKARARALALRNGYRADVAEAFVDPGAVVEIDGEILSAEGEILALTAPEAVRKTGDGPLLAKAILSSAEEVLEAEGIGAEILRITPGEFATARNLERVGKNAESSGTGSGAATEEGAAASPPGEAGTPDDGAEAPPIFGRRDSADLADRIVVLEVGEDALHTGKARFEFMDRILKKAELDGAVAVIFDIDSPGGVAWYTQGLVLDSLQDVTLPTYAFVNPRAESAGAIVALGTDHIYMRPAATIGSALVVGATGTDLAESMEDKVTQMIIATVRNIAEVKGHNPDVAEAMVTRDKEVRIAGEIVHEAGNVLNLNTIDATEVIGGKPVLAKGVARDLGDLIAQEGLSGEIYVAEPLGMESFAHLIQKFAAVLLIIGLAGAYLEMNQPGFGLPGAVSVCAFGLFFFGNYLAGNLAGYELAVLFVLGMLLLAAEIFLFPGSIVPGAVGGALVLGSLGFAMVDRVDLEWQWKGLAGDSSWGEVFGSAAWTLSLGVAGSLVLILALMRYLPGSRVGSWMVLEEALPGGGSLSGPAGRGVGRSAGSGEDSGAGDSTEKTDAEKKGAPASWVGQEGEALTDLRPAGKGRIGEKVLDVLTAGEFLAKGGRFVVVRHEGSRVVVRSSGDSE